MAGSPRRSMLKSERRRCCGSRGSSIFVSAVCRPVTEGEEVSAVVVGESGDPLSGLAIRKPPNDCERLKSPSMSTRPVEQSVRLRIFGESQAIGAL